MPTLIAAVSVPENSSVATLEALLLRVKDLDFTRREITVREGKGNKDRITMLPEVVIRILQDHIRRVQMIHQHDLELGYGRVELPNAVARKYPNANRDWNWQFVFPQEHRSVDPQSGSQGRHHLHESLVQKAVCRIEPAGLLQSNGLSQSTKVISRNDLSG